MQSNENNYKGAEWEEIKEKNHLIAKKNLVRDHSVMTSAISASIQFWSKGNPLLEVLNWHSMAKCSFGFFLKNPMRSTYWRTNVFFVKVYNNYCSHKYNKTDRKVNRISPSRLLRMANVPAGLQVKYKRSFRMETVETFLVN